MSEFVSSLTIFRDILLLAINIGIFVMLFIIAGQMNGQRRVASALVTHNNEFRNHLKGMVIKVESTDLSDPDTPSEEVPPLGDFKTLRKDVDLLGKHITETLDGLQSLTRQSTDSLDKLVSGLRDDRKQDRDLAKEFQNTLRANLHSQQSKTPQVNAPVQVSTTALDNSLQKWLARTQEMHESILEKVQISRHASDNENANTTGSDLALKSLSQTVENHQKSMQKLLTDFMNENIRQTRGAEEFRNEMRQENVRRLRATDELRAAIQQDVKTQADRLRQLVDAHPAASPSSTTLTTGTITTSAGDSDGREWRDGVQTELKAILEKLDRMHDRMEEIFQI